MEIAFERIERLKISEGNTHPIGAMRFLLAQLYLKTGVKGGGVLFTERIREIDVIDINKRNTSPPCSLVIDKIRAICTYNTSNNN